MDAGVTPPSSGPARKEAEALHVRARERAAAGDYGEALTLCRRALELDDDDAAIRATYKRLLATIGPF
jgi:Flp pilus assembly protein TadD